MPSFDSFEDERNWNAVKTTGRKKLVISGLWTSMCFAYSALHALKGGLEVYGLIDAAGDSTPDAHKYGVERMLSAHPTCSVLICKRGMKTILPFS